MTERFLDDPDVQRMLRIREGDAVAFEEFVSAYAPVLINFMRRFVGNDVVAEDLAQEVFLKVHRAAPTYEPTARFKTWLLTIATNLCLNEKRRSGRRSHQSLEALGEGDEVGRSRDWIADEGPMPEARLESGELQEKVRAAIAALPESQRAVVLMARYEQLSYVEMAQATGLTIMAVKSLLNRAKTNLKKHLSREIRDFLVAPPEENA
ncbi:MAG: sigma-70 family RNA polymerase sigma factor [Planctomycetota bacterium]